MQMKYFSLFLLLLPFFHKNLRAQPQIKKDTLTYSVPPPPIETIPPPSIFLSDFDEEEGNAPVGYSPPVEEIIANLNKPLILSSFEAKVQEIVKKADTQIEDIIGKEHRLTYLRISREDVENMEGDYKKNYYFRRYNPEYGGIQLTYIVVYEEVILGSIWMKLDTMGQLLPKYKKAIMEDLTAYKELFDGKVKVQPKEVLQAVFGNSKPEEIYHLSLKTNGGTWYSSNVANTPNYTRPKLLWHIWQNGCTTCKEAEVDANNIENKSVIIVHPFRK